MSQQPGYHKTRYEVITQEDENGDMLIPIPLPVLRSLGWNEGDNVEVGIDKNGDLCLKKAYK